MFLFEIPFTGAMPSSCHDVLRNINDINDDDDKYESKENAIDMSIFYWSHQ